MAHVYSTVEDCNLDFLCAGSPTRRHDRMDIAEEVTEPSVGCHGPRIVSLLCKIGIIKTDASACADEVSIEKSSNSKPPSAEPRSASGPALCAGRFPAAMSSTVAAEEFRIGGVMARADSTVFSVARTLSGLLGLETCGSDSNPCSKCRAQKDNSLSKTSSSKYNAVSLLTTLSFAHSVL